jgi:ribosomal protein S18 acetylase RimI-like enzyme
MAIKVVYTTPENTPLVTETLQTWEETRHILPALRTVLHKAYSRELADRLHIIDQQRLDKHYSPYNWLAFYNFAAAAHDIHERGARITLLRDTEARHVIGFSKVGPAPALTKSHNNPKGYDYEGYYLNNIAVHPDIEDARWGRGMGSMLLHANFLAQACDHDLPLVLDAIDGSERVNAWYQRLGMEPQPEIPTDVIEFDGFTIPETYYVTPDSVLLRGVVQRLEEKRPWLRTAEIIS